MQLIGPRFSEPRLLSIGKIFQGIFSIGSPPFAIE